MNRSARSHKKGTIFWEFIVHSHEKKKHPQTWYHRNIMNMNTMKVMRHGSIKLIIQKVFAHSYLSSFRLRSSLSIPHPSHWHPYLFFHTHWSILDKDQANRKEILGVGVQYDHYWRHVAIPMSYNFCPYHTHFDADMDLGSSYK